MGCCSELGAYSALGRRASLDIDVNIHYTVCLKQTESESGAERKDKQHCLGKKMMAIAWTMRRGKKHIKPCSEDAVSHREPHVRFQHH